MDLLCTSVVLSEYYMFPPQMIPVLLDNVRQADYKLTSLVETAERIEQDLWAECVVSDWRLLLAPDLVVVFCLNANFKSSNADTMASKKIGYFARLVDAHPSVGRIVDHKLLDGYDWSAYYNICLRDDVVHGFAKS